MCGIAGIYSQRYSREELSHYSNVMMEALIHRGPDDNGLNVLSLPHNWSLGLAHVRLSILDPTPRGHQPMTTRKKKLWISHNGEIYNFREIRNELCQYGCEFETETDTEVILHAYRVWGLDGIAKFNGMWAFSLVDLQRGMFILSRDRLGIKPLYFAWLNGTLLFASEIKALLTFPGMDRALNRRGVFDYLSYRYVLGEKTLFNNIFSLLPGHHLCINDGSAKMIPYWELPIPSVKDDPGEQLVAEQTASLVHKAVKYRMISDVPVGAYLSGGLDSSVVVEQMAELSNVPIKTFNIGFYQQDFNEFDFAQQVANRFHTDHHEIRLQSTEYIEKLPDVIRFRDAPLSAPNEVPLFVLSQELKKHITVVLSGEGADELFGGYGRIFRSALDCQRLMELRDGRVDLNLEQLESLRCNLRKKYPKLEYVDELQHFLSQYSYIAVEELELLLQSEIFSESSQDPLNYSYFGSYYSQLGSLNMQEKFMWLFQKIHLLGLLHRLDAMTMAWAVEARVPFVDHNLVEYVTALPLHYKMRWKSLLDEAEASILNSDQYSEHKDITKYILRKIFTEKLPHDITCRRKLGFPVPFNHWIDQKEFREMVKDFLLSSSSKTRSLFKKSILENWLGNQSVPTSTQRGLNIWMVMNLEIWAREYHVSL